MKQELEEKLFSDFPLLFIPNSHIGFECVEGGIN